MFSLGHDAPNKSSNDLNDYEVQRWVTVIKGIKFRNEDDIKKEFYGETKEVCPFRYRVKDARVSHTIMLIWIIKENEQNIRYKNYFSW